MKAVNLLNNEECFFIDKCLPFGASISCAIFQAFSDGLYHIFEFSIGSLDITTNYLDDFLFIALSILQCNRQILKFLELCDEVGCPISMEKTVWATDLLVFLGTLLDGKGHCLCVLVEKKTKAINQINYILSKRTATIKEIQSLTGLLNFLNRVIVPGRAFTR